MPIDQIAEIKIRMSDFQVIDSFITLCVHRKSSKVLNVRKYFSFGSSLDLYKVCCFCLFCLFVFWHWFQGMIGVVDLYNAIFSLLLTRILILWMTLSFKEFFHQRSFKNIMSTISIIRKICSFTNKGWLS